MRPKTEPGARRAVVMMLLPALLLTVLIVGYVASRGGEATEEQVRSVLPYMIALNHTAVFVVLLVLLKREGRSLESIGWRGGAGPAWVREVGVGLAFGLVFYLLKELGFDAIEALVAGSRPTFNSLFRFRIDTADVPLLAVATTFIAVEESVYRGYGLPPLVRRWGAPAGLLVMGLLFGLLHWGNGVPSILFTGTLGVLFGVLFLWRGTLIAPVVAHALYNAMVILT